MQDPKLSNTFQRFKRCAGRECRKLAEWELKIIYINRVGTFCTTCRDKLVELGLVSEFN